MIISCLRPATAAAQARRLCKRRKAERHRSRSEPLSVIGRGRAPRNGVGFVAKGESFIKAWQLVTDLQIYDLAVGVPSPNGVDTGVDGGRSAAHPLITFRGDSHTRQRAIQCILTLEFFEFAFSLASGHSLCVRGDLLSGGGSPIDGGMKRTHWMSFATSVRCEHHFSRCTRWIEWFW